VSEEELMEVVAEGPEGKAAASPKRGETPRQQIHKAKAVSRRQFSAEEKIRIVMEGIRGDLSISELCRRERVHTTACRPETHPCPKVPSKRSHGRSTSAPALMPASRAVNRDRRSQGGQERSFVTGWFWLTNADALYIRRGRSEAAPQPRADRASARAAYLMPERETTDCC
jgi:hypothetical protein